jgi:hypothetical protein
VWQSCARTWPTGSQIAGGEPFEAAAVERADADPVVPGQPVGTDMAQFAMGEAVDRHAAGDQADADAGADRHVSDIAQPLGGAPARLRQRRADDIGMKTGRHLVARREPLGDVGPRPMRLGGRGDMAVIGGVPVDRDRAEAGDAERIELAPAVEDMLDSRQRLFGPGGRQLHAILDRIRPARQQADDLGPTQFDTGYQRGDADHDRFSLWRGR